MRQSEPTHELKPIDQSSLIKIHREAHKYYHKEDFSFFEEINTMGAVKYEVIKEVLLSDDFGVSPMHTALNNIYFQTNLEKHAHNKRAAIKHLEFLSKKLQFTGCAYVAKLFELMRKNLPQGEVFDLADQLINPIILVNALNDLGFLQVLTTFDPDKEEFSYARLVAQSKEIFENRSSLEALMRKVMTEENRPALIKDLLDEIGKEVKWEKEDLPLFYTTVIYTAIENTASFVGSLVYFVLSSYPELLQMKEGNVKQLMALSNEVLRIFSPNFITFRTALKDTEIRGVPFKKGSLIALFIGAANKDPEVFQDAEKIKFDRENKHLAFGRGRISCIGQFAAFRMALNIVGEIAAGAEKLEVINPEPVYVTQGVVRLSAFEVIYHGS